MDHFVCFASEIFIILELLGADECLKAARKRKRKHLKKILIHKNQAWNKYIVNT